MKALFLVAVAAITAADVAFGTQVYPILGVDSLGALAGFCGAGGLGDRA